MKTSKRVSRGRDDLKAPPQLPGLFITPAFKRRESEHERVKERERDRRPKSGTSISSEDKPLFIFVQQPLSTPLSTSPTSITQNLPQIAKTKTVVKTIGSQSSPNPTGILSPVPLETRTIRSSSTLLEE